jgi:hypothetical protein
MEQTGKEVRILLQKKLNEIRQNKGIKLSEMNLTDEAGKSLSEAQKSMLFSGKRQMGLWLIFQIAKALNTTIGFNPNYINVVDFQMLQKYVKIDTMTSEELASICIGKESVGPYQIRCMQPMDADE